MRVVCKAVITEKYVSEKSGKTYYTFADLDQGGTGKITVDGELEGVKPGSMVAIDAVCKPYVNGQNMSLTYQSGSFVRLGQPDGK